MGARAGFRRIQTTDGDINRLQDNVAGVFEDLTKEALLGARVIKNVALAVGTNFVAHGLGRNYLTWWPANQIGAASITLGSGNPDASQWIAVVASAACVADVVVV